MVPVIQCQLEAADLSDIKKTRKNCGSSVEREDETSDDGIDKWTYKDILEHRKSCPRDGGYELRILWNMQQMTWEPLKNFIADCQHRVVNYARRNRLLGLPEFKGLEGYLDESNNLLAEGSDWDSGNFNNPGNSWFAKAQDLMLNLPQLELLSHLIGRLYIKSKKIAKEAENGIYDEDAEAFGKAYKKALELEKHSGKVYLPDHLHDRIPKGCRIFLTCTEE